ncbi:unnamed protein product [Chilo suppressalis]|uniref:Palmitoyltransferase n=1 Tax=Chilo suppressalis TaxID=168631 RepID=A0ABN8LBF3_CHISP|nr:unnamed protein product [Chilo suppressalis]
MKQNKKLLLCRYIFEKVMAFGLIFLLTPGYYIFHMTIVRPYLIKIFKMGTAMHVFHVFLSLFIFINVCGNMFLALLTDNRVPRMSLCQNEKFGRYCVCCKLEQPRKSFHCETCGVCILRRDHHCFFFSRCIGLNNQRYYIMYLTYISIGLIYSTYYDYFFVSSMYDSYDFIIALLRVFNPLVSFISTEPVGIRDLYVLFFDLNVIFIFWATTVLWFHVKNMMMGITAYEHKKIIRSDMTKWNENLLNVFGKRWYWAVLWPFVESPLPRSNNFSRID